MKHFAFPIFCLLLFSLLVYGLSEGEISRTSYWRLQVDWFITLNHQLASWSVLFANLTQLGDALILLPILSFLIIWKPQAWAAMFGAIPLGAILSVGSKYMAWVPRPAVVLDPDSFTVIGSALKGYHSLPSGHTITLFGAVAAVMLVVAPLAKREDYWLHGMGLGMALLLAASRVAVGVHWPLDIVAGAALGYLAGLNGVFLTQRYPRWWHWLTLEKYQFIFGTIMLIWGLGLFNRVLRESDEADRVIWVAAIIACASAFILLQRSVNYLLLKTTLTSSSFD